ARYKLGQHDVTVPLLNGKTWQNTPGGAAETQMRIAGIKPYSDGQAENPQVFGNAVSHWWDTSEVYGDAENASKLRDGAKLKLDAGYLPPDHNRFGLTGFNEGWWLGLGILHTLFAREHNLLCDELRAHYKGWSDERVYQTARLIVSALIAKIHTVEWTPAILGTEALDIAMNINWSGPRPSD